MYWHLHRALMITIHRQIAVSPTKLLCSNTKTPSQVERQDRITKARIQEWPLKGTKSPSDRNNHHPNKLTSQATTHQTSQPPNTNQPTAASHRQAILSFRSGIQLREGTRLPQQTTVQRFTRARKAGEKVLHYRPVFRRKSSRQNGRQRTSATSWQ